jgi:organic radical activating enzyme
MDETVKLIENFVSWQGEGPDAGHSMIILRFKSCNLRCPWCDTSVKMRISAEAPYTLSSIQETINKTRSGLMITGGEPTVDRHIKDCISLLNNLNYPIANVETNGYNLETLIKEVNPAKPIHYMYSPKIFDENDISKAKKLTKKILNNPNVFIKYVFEEAVLDEWYLEWLAKQIGLEHSNKVWLMPEGTTREKIIMNSGVVFDACEKYRFNFSSRNHVIYGFV